MKHLGQIQIGGSLDITTNKHVEELVEEALKGIEFPEDTNTTYTLTQDGLTIQLVDDSGGVVSTIELPEVEDTVYTLRAAELDRGRHQLDLVNEEGRMVSRVFFTIPEDTNTTYTLTQDDTKIQLVDDGGGVVSEVDISQILPEDKDPYQEVKSIALPPVNLYEMLNSRARGNESFDIYSEFDPENNLISIYLHLDVNGVERTFTLANNVSNQWTYYNNDGSIKGSIDLVDVVRSERGDVFMLGFNTENHNTLHGSGIRLMNAAVQPTADSSLSNHSEGLVIYDDGILGTGRSGYFIFPDVDAETVSDHEVITATLEEHLQNVYESIHLYN